MNNNITPTENSLAPPSLTQPKHNNLFTFPYICKVSAYACMVLLLICTSLCMPRIETYIPSEKSDVPVIPEQENQELVNRQDGAFQTGTTELEYEEVQTTVTYEPNATCFIGGHRVQQMEGTVLTDIHFITSVNDSPEWLSEKAEKEINDNKNQIKLCVVSVGLNDLNKGEQYVKILNEWTTKYPNISFAFVSLGPIDESMYMNFSNDEIYTFNTYMQENLNDKWRFVDQYTYLCTIGIESENGLSYSNSLNASLLSWILSSTDTDDITEYVPVNNN